MTLTDAIIGGGGVGRGVGAGVGRGVATTGFGVGAGVATGVAEAVGDGVGLPTGAWLAAGEDWLIAGAPQPVSKNATTIANAGRSMSTSVEKSVGG